MSARWQRYVAVGDSFSEGMCDESPTRPGTYVGWTDRLAAHLADDAAEAGTPFEYANIAIRGRLLADIVDNQVPRAIAMQPDLVSICGGGNDIMRPRADLDALAAQLEGAVVALREAGADVLMATPTDPKGAPIIGRLRPRQAIFTAHVWTIARRHGCHVIDQWGMTALQDWRMWAEDRIHMTSEGHRRVAQAAYTALGLDAHDGEWHVPLPPAAPPSRAEWARANRDWAVTYLRPWVHRRLTGRSSGDGITPKRPAPAPWE